MDVGHVVLAAAVVLVTIVRFRGHRRRRFNLTIVLTRDEDDEAGSDPE